MKTEHTKIYGSGGALDLFFRIRVGDPDLSGIDIHGQVAEIEETYPRFNRFLTEKIRNQIRDYEVQDESSCATEIIATYPEKIRTEARAWLKDGYADEVGQEYCDVNWTDLLTGDYDSSRCIVGTDDPPDCETGEDHDWRSPHSVVGGLRDNPGVWAIGGTETKTVEVCRNCGMYRVRYSESTPGQYPEHPEYYEYEDADDASLAYVDSETEA